MKDYFKNDDKYFSKTTERMEDRKEDNEGSKKISDNFNKNVEGNNYKERKATIKVIGRVQK